MDICSVGPSEDQLEAVFLAVTLDYLRLEVVNVFGRRSVLGRVVVLVDLFDVSCFEGRISSIRSTG